MDVTCPKCGAANRSTSRFCARCGEALPHPESAEQGEELNLPWLQAVQEKAEVLRTGGLKPEMVPDDEPEQGAAPEAQQASTAETPEQAQRAGEGRPAPPEETEPLPTAPRDEGSPGEPPPEWVVGILEPGTTPQGAGEPTYEPEEIEHIMPWLGDEQKQGAAAIEGSPGLPPWLGDMTVQESLQGKGQAAEPKADSLRQIEGVQPFVPPELEQPEEPDRPADASPVPARPGEPESVQPFVPPELEPPREPDRPANIPPAPTRPGQKVPEWLKTIAPPEPVEEREPRIERTTPVTKVVLDSADTLAEPAVKDIPVRPPRPGSVETLAALMAPPAEAELVRPVPGATAQLLRSKQRRAGLRQWLLPDGIIYVGILVALLTVILARPPFGEINTPPADDAILFYNAVETTPTDRPVLVVYDWDASRSAEMAILSRAVTHHLMARDLRFVTLSTVPQGPGFAREVTLAAANDPGANFGYTYGQDYLVLGYLPGNEAALGALMRDFSQALPLDYVNNESIRATRLVQASGINSLDDFGLIIALSSDEAALRNWIEQVATRINVPLLAGVPQGLEPVARPYRNLPGGGLRAVVSGQGGAMQYTEQLVRGRNLTSLYSPTALADRLNTQSVAQILVALTILGALVGMAARTILRRRAA